MLTTHLQTSSLHNYRNPRWPWIQRELWGNFDKYCLELAGHRACKVWRGNIDRLVPSVGWRERPKGQQITLPSVAGRGGCHPVLCGSPQRTPQMKARLWLPWKDPTQRVLPMGTRQTGRDWWVSCPIGAKGIVSGQPGDVTLFREMSPARRSPKTHKSDVRKKRPWFVK